MYNTICYHCEAGYHEQCEIGKLPPEGYMGGWNCICDCGRGKELFKQPRTPKYPKVRIPKKLK